MSLVSDTCTVLFQVAMLLGVGVLCPSALAQDAASGVTTKFEKDATLTAQQVQTVLQLAKDCGLAEPVEVSIGRTRPLNRRFVIVRGKDHKAGRRSFYEQVDIWFSKWEKVAREDTSVKQLGEFRVTPPYIVKMQFATFEVGGKPVTVQMADETISLQVADRIIDAFATKKLRLHSRPVVDMDSPTLREPRWLSYDQRSKEYEIYFGAGLSRMARCKLIGEDVVVTMGPTYVMH